jgi:hypothetical protein
VDLRQHPQYVLMATSSNFGNMFSAAGASLFLSFCRPDPGGVRDPHPAGPFFHSRPSLPMLLTAPTCALIGAARRSPRWPASSASPPYPSASS